MTLKLSHGWWLWQSNYPTQFFPVDYLSWTTSLNAPFHVYSALSKNTTPRFPVPSGPWCLPVLGWVAGPQPISSHCPSTPPLQAQEVLPLRMPSSPRRCTPEAEDRPMSAPGGRKPLRVGRVVLAVAAREGAASCPEIFCAGMLSRAFLCVLCQGNHHRSPMSLISVVFLWSICGSWCSDLAGVLSEHSGGL